MDLRHHFLNNVRGLDQVLHVLFFHLLDIGLKHVQFVINFRIPQIQFGQMFLRSVRLSHRPGTIHHNLIDLRPECSDSGSVLLKLNVELFLILRESLDKQILQLLKLVIFKLQFMGHSPHLVSEFSDVLS